MAKITALLQNTLAAVPDEDKEYVSQYLTENQTYIVDGQLFYEPYKNLITDTDSFYQYASLNFLSCPEDEGDYYLLATESFRDEETLVLRKDNGNIFYNSYTKQLIWAASNFLELWNKLKRGANSVAADYYQADTRDVVLSQPVQQAIHQCFGLEDNREIIEIYKTINANDLCEGANFTELNFYTKSNFSLWFPFVKVESGKYDPLPEGDWWEIGLSNEDEDTGPDDCFLLMDSLTGHVLRCSVIDSIVLSLIEKKTTIQSIFDLLFPFKSKTIKIDYFVVAKSLSEFLQKCPRP